MGWRLTFRLGATLAVDKWVAAAKLNHVPGIAAPAARQARP